MDTEHTTEKFPTQLKNFTAQVKVASPGRINLIGEHTDYNNGFVMPTAIDKKIYFEFRKNNTPTTCRVYSETYKAYLEFEHTEFSKSDKSWENYILGVTSEILKKGKTIEGFDCILRSELSTGAGISSSAALECGFASGLNALFNLNLSEIEIAQLSQKAEHNFVGNNCGIMDQFASVLSKKDHIILLDCESLKADYIPADFKNCKLLLLNTNVSHSLADSEYNTRRKECESAVDIIKIQHPEVKSLRDVSFEMLESAKDKIDEKSYQRSLYVLRENERVQKATEAIKVGNLNEFGKLMYGSHEGLQHDYEVSCKELDFLVEFSKDKNYIYGSRMMGGGFGGCTINLIEADKIDEYVNEAEKAYFDKFQIRLDAIAVTPSAGTQIEYL